MLYNNTILIRLKMSCKKALNMMSLKELNKNNQSSSKNKLFVIKMKMKNS